jgi:hypothetical protein
MKLSLLASALVLSSLSATGASAQIATAVSPRVAALGQPISVSITNNTGRPISSKPCPFRVYDDTGNSVYAPWCIFTIVNIDPGATQVVTWDQIDDVWGWPVSAGTYRMEVDVPGGGIDQYLVQLDGTGAAVDGPLLTALSPPANGTSASFLLDAPAHPGANYFMSFSGSANTGIPVCGGVMPLDADALFYASLSSPATFQNMLGTLDGHPRHELTLPGDGLLDRAAVHHPVDRPASGGRQALSTRGRGRRPSAVVVHSALRLVRALRRACSTRHDESTMMRRRPRWLPVLLLALAAAACQAPSYQMVPRPADDAAAPASETCRIYLARSAQLWGRIRSIEVVDRGTEIGSIGRDGYLCWDRAPDRSPLQVLYHGAVLDGGVVEGLLDFDGAAGEVYYYAVHLRPSDLKPQFELLDPAAGRALIADRKAATLR